MHDVTDMSQIVLQWFSKCTSQWLPKIVFGGLKCHTVHESYISISMLLDPALSITYCAWSVMTAGLECVIKFVKEMYPFSSLIIIFDDYTHFRAIIQAEFVNCVPKQHFTNNVYLFLPKPGISHGLYQYQLIKAHVDINSLRPNDAYMRQ